MKFWWQQIPSTIITEMLCKTTFDGVVLDLEHGCFNHETSLCCIQIAQALSKKVYVRYPYGYIDHQIIHSGVDGLICADVRGEFEKNDIGIGLDRSNNWSLNNGYRLNLIAQIERPESLHGICSTKEYKYYMLTPIDFMDRNGKISDIDYFCKIIPVEKRAIHHGIKNISEYCYDAEWKAYGVDALLIKNAIGEAEKVCVL